jgi:hypothetical protein
VLWDEWNGKYRDTVRRFWKGDRDTLAEFATRFSGSSALYQNDWRKPSARLGSEGRATIRLLTVTVVGDYRARAESLTATTCKANSTKVCIFRTPAKLYSCETLLERLAQDL